MRKLTPALLFCLLLVLIFVGCSNSVDQPLLPDEETNRTENISGTEYNILEWGTMNLDTGNIETGERDSMAYINVTRFLGSNFSYLINGLIPPDTVDITMTIDNVSPFSVYDVCIVFDNLHGKTVLNPDSYIDIFKPWTINPFIAFMKEDPARFFPPGMDSEQLLLKYPAGADPMIDFFIIAHVNQNTGGVYEIRDWNVSGTITPAGGSATLQVTTKDHQGDVDGVWADTSIITGDITIFNPTADPEIWEAEITNSTGAPVSVYTVPVMSKSHAQPKYQTYNYFEIRVTDPGALKIHSVNFRPSDPGDIYHDVCVEKDGFVYVCADHVATGNVDDLRTALRFDNDLTHVAVINEAMGMNDPEVIGLELYWNRIDVTDGGNLVTNPGYQTIASWEVVDTTATLPYVSNALSCFSGWPGCRGFADVWDQYEASYGSAGLGWAETMDCLTDFAVALKRPDGGTSGGFGGMSIPSMYDFDSIVGINGIDNTQNCVFFISDGVNDKLSLSGSWLETENTSMTEIVSVGAPGVGDAEFTGGLDVAVDSQGNVVTLEYHGSGFYRFQKFDSTLGWAYGSPWQDDGDPIRMDFDRDDDMLYLISSTGLHIMEVY